MPKFINIALAIFKIFKIVTPTTFPMKFDSKQTWYKWGQRKNGRVHPISFCGWPSKIFHDLLKFRWNPFLHLPENLRLNRSIILYLFKMFFYYQTIDRVFLKTLRKAVHVDSCFFTYFHIFGKEPVNPQESIFEKILLVRIHLQVWIFTYQYNFDYWWKLTFLNQLFSKFQDNVIWPMKAKSAISAKIFF